MLAASFWRKVYIKSQSDQSLSSSAAGVALSASRAKERYNISAVDDFSDRPKFASTPNENADAPYIKFTSTVY
jgi:hypothetical protein